MNLNFLKIIKKKFSFKVFFAFAILIFLISSSFTFFVINYQNNLLKHDLIRKGFLFLDVLAYNSKIGIFSGNQELIHDSVNEIFQQEEILKAFIFTAEGKLLKRLKNPQKTIHIKTASGGEGNNSQLFEKLKKSKAPIYKELKNRLEFWTPVFAISDYSHNELMFFGIPPDHSNAHIIGFAGIVIDKTKLNKQMKSFLFKGLQICSVFLIVGFGIAYFLATKITKPLRSLTESVKSLETGNGFEEVSVEADDELGDLAKAFNSMAVSLNSREKALEESKKKLQFLSGQLLKTQEEERSTISRELHDELGQTLAFLKVRLSSIGRQLNQEHSSLQKDCEETCQYMDQIIENIRRLSRDLSPHMLKDLGLTTSLKVQSRDFTEHYNIALSCNIEDINNIFSEAAQINIFRFLQETLTNISKHAQAKNLSVAVAKAKNNVTFIVEDDGKGFDVDHTINMNSSKKGIGLTVLEERSYMLEGALDIWSEPGKGTRITLTIPIETGQAS